MDTVSDGHECISQRVPVDQIVPVSLVRTGIDHDHVARLAEVLEECPPIELGVDGRIVDGVHRVEAARLRGWVAIPAITVPLASRAEILLAAARANSCHGLPLSREERRAAVAELLLLASTLSDRTIAEACGVARSVVASVRATQQPCSGGRCDNLNRRTGSDGKKYPAHPVTAGPVAAALVRLHPAISVRALASKLQVSVGTAHRLRVETLARVEKERPWNRVFRRLLARLLLWRVNSRRVDQRRMRAS